MNETRIHEFQIFFFLEKCVEFIFENFRIYGRKLK